MFRFETLEIWRIAIDLSKKIYKVSDGFPTKLQYNLGSQLRSAVLSISNNIAEGSGSNSNKEFKSFLNCAVRSAYEAVSMLFIVKDSGYMTRESFDEYYSGIETLIKKIKSFKNTL